jgi:hypothetical protein
MIGMFGGSDKMDSTSRFFKISRTKFALSDQSQIAGHLVRNALVLGWFIFEFLTLLIHDHFRKIFPCRERPRFEVQGNYSAGSDEPSTSCFTFSEMAMD